ncbi:hypothetical protein JDN40_10515 [Rhodomicrobium vannielii ATCC 17100]|uniref:CAP domain-containing protein n=1 Tax=Rhodomicrobium vannielii TaxID=1069 RepID=UPI0019192E11|nr:CAP domain-containing protein [Rhodomicrobium vannielii]MBJ7534537.1 hypothetical protein [Rhodomicrobium vannielii ATCC 17100]
MSSRLFLVVLAAMTASGMAAAHAQDYPLDRAAVSRAVIAETNAWRAAKRLPPLSSHPQLEAAATAYARHLAQTEGVGHTADGRSPAIRVRATGYNYCFVAENMWGGWRRPNPMTEAEASRKAMDDWKKSPGHNANLLSKGKNIGVGVAAWRQGDRVVFRMVQVFGTADCAPRPKAKPFVTKVTQKVAPKKAPAAKPQQKPNPR